MSVIFLSLRDTERNVTPSLSFPAIANTIIRIISFNLPKNFMRKLIYFHSTDEKTETQRGLKCAQRHTGSKWQSWDLDPGSICVLVLKQHLILYWGISGLPVWFRFRWTVKGLRHMYPWIRIWALNFCSVYVCYHLLWKHDGGNRV